MPDVIVPDVGAAITILSMGYPAVAVAVNGAPVGAADPVFEPMTVIVTDAPVSLVIETAEIYAVALVPGDAELPKLLNTVFTSGGVPELYVMACDV